MFHHDLVRDQLENSCLNRYLFWNIISQDHWN